MKYVCTYVFLTPACIYVDTEMIDTLLVQASRAGQDPAAPASTRGAGPPGDLASQDCLRTLSENGSG